MRCGNHSLLPHHLVNTLVGNLHPKHFDGAETSQGQATFRHTTGKQEMTEDRRDIRGLYGEV